MRILLTGIAGFIGSHLGERLLARGDEVVGLDDFCDNYDPALKRDNAARLTAEIVEGDVGDSELLDRLFASYRFDVVVHLAALPGVRPSILEPARYQRVNVEGTATLAHAMVAHDVGRLVFASSSSVYGRNRERPYRESDRVDAPASPYAASKRAGELLLSSLHHVHGLGVTCLRYFTVYGPRQRPEMAVHAFMRAIEQGRPVQMFGSGTTSRDYTYIDDIVDGTVAAIDQVERDFRVYNLGDNQPVVLRDLVAKIGEALGREPRIETLADQPGDVEHTLAAIEAASRDLGYRPKVGIDEGLRRFAEWMRGEARR
jgi:UDP-glucuronate 4-epimerase